jgi:hypothetical protein
MSGNEIVVLGIPIPSDDPWFLAALVVHVPAGAVCVVAGLFAMLSRKRPGWHPTAGSIYYWSLLVVFITATIVSVMRWAENYHLFILGVLAFATASFGRTARRRPWPGWATLHIGGMGASYIFLLTAFYVDNGPNLPLWRELPNLVFWVLPSAIGLPIIIYAVFRHPLAQPMERHPNT